MDVVIASHVLEHVADDRTMLQEMRRVLRPGGVAVVLVPINENYDDPNHVRHYDLPSLIERSEEAGLHLAVGLENERLYHFVERFYFEGFSKRWKVLGPVIVALFNVPTALLPFWLHRIIDSGLASLGLRPRQAGLALVPASAGGPTGSRQPGAV